MREADGRKRLPSLAVDLSILLTAWAAEPERQLRLTGWLMRFLEDNAIVPAALLELRDPNGVIRAQWPSALWLLAINLALIWLFAFA